MPDVQLGHFKRAISDNRCNGDNDTLPFDIDNRFISENEDKLAHLANSYFQDLDRLSKSDVKNAINSLEVFSERLLAPTGVAGFRITTKLHPFWNLYLNGLGAAIAEAHEPMRSNRAHSYRYMVEGDEFFNRSSSWRSFRESCIKECQDSGEDVVVAQTDISGFYEHINHHRIENCIGDLFPIDSKVAVQIDRFLSKLSSGRSFGLPVGGQFSRVLAELVLSAVDNQLTDAGIKWHRYVDDFVLITSSQAEAYSALASLSHALADYGLSLNRTKTTILTGKHFCDYVRTQLGGSDDSAMKLREISLHFDPYSDTCIDDYEELKKTVESLEVGSLLDFELNKSQPDTFLVSQIGRTLKYQSPAIALQLCDTLLSSANLHAFRASWSTIMRGVSMVRSDPVFEGIHHGIDSLLDEIPVHSSHLLHAEASSLHYLRAIRFRRTEQRGRFVANLYAKTQSQSVRRACVECWRLWGDRHNFQSVRNCWNSLNPEVQRMLWLSASDFGDEGLHFRAQEKRSALNSWSLGIEKQGRSSFASIYQEWCSS